NEDEVRKSVIVPPDSQFTIATYYRLYFHALIPEGIDKLLYIDTDTIVIGDLKELYNIDIGNAPIAAVADPVPELRSDLGLYKEGQYFNAGVLLIDIKNWREQKVTENALQFILDHPEKIQYVDQDALNATLIDKWFRIDKKYNLSYLYVSLQVPAKALIKDAVIIHYTTSLKPWHCLAKNKLRYLYQRYLKMSPKSNEKKYIDFKWTLPIVRTFVRMRIKEFYFNKEIYKIFPIKGWINAGELY
nr:glycosyltransferase family 8 protein [Segetibacter sp.]